MKYRLAIIDSHPIQYRVPLFKKLARSPHVDLCVYYCSKVGAIEYHDQGFGIKLKWDTSLLEGYHYEFLRNYSFLSSPNQTWGLFNPGIIKELKRGKYDAILIHGYYSITNRLIAFAAPFLKIPVIFIGETLLHKPFGIIKRSFLKLFFHNIKAFLYIGKKSFEFYRHLKIPQERLFFTPYSVDNDFFISEVDRWRSNKEQIKKEVGVLNDLPVILYVSKIIPRKRPQDLLEAFSKICTKAALVFVGEGKMRPLLERYVYKQGIKNVFFLGFKNQSELPLYYAIADIFVLPSSFEPWGLVVNEAMCASLPVISTYAVAASYDLVHHGDNGYVFSVGDINNLTKALDELITNPQKCKKMGARSLEIISGWNYDICTQGIVSALSRLS